MKNKEELQKLEPITIIVTSYNRLDFLKKTIDSINERTFYPYRIMVVDNASTDGSIRYLKTAKVRGKIFDHLFLPENIGQSRALNAAFKELESWEFERRRPSNDLFVTTNDDIYPPMFGQKNCWLRRMVDIFERHEPEYGGICMRIQRTSRNDINELKEIIPCYKGFPSVFRLIRRSDFRRLGDRPFGRLMKWDSNSTADKMKLFINKKFGFTTHIYADHAGFVVNNGYKEGTDSFTLAANKIRISEEKPYPEIDPDTNEPIKINHPVDTHEQDAREEYNKQSQESDAIRQVGTEMAVIKENHRSRTTKIELDSKDFIKKVFKKREYMARGIRAHELFSKYNWMTPIIYSGFDYYLNPYFEIRHRLDVYVAGKDAKWKEMIAGKILLAIMEMHIAGYSHRDIHAKNIFVDGDGIKIIDFEYLKKIKGTVSFLDTYDIVGRGMSSPCNARNMCYTKCEKSSIWKCLDVDMKHALWMLTLLIKEELFEVSGIFKRIEGEHHRNKGRSYSSFELPTFMIYDAQRDTQKRLDKFGITEKYIGDKTVLDLGSNVGGMLLGIEKYKPKYGVGLEYLKNQVDVANKIATLEGFSNINFVCGDIDELDGNLRTFDVVFCFAINKHVKDEDKLYDTLGKVAGKKLYFEGNDGTNNEYVIKRLTEVGFKDIEYIGVYDDDIKKKNNVRPLFIANK